MSLRRTVKADSTLILRCFRRLQSRKYPLLVSDLRDTDNNTLKVKNAMHCLMKLGVVEKVPTGYQMGKDYLTRKDVNGYLLKKGFRK